MKKLALHGWDKSMSDPLGVGVIGLGRRWRRRYRSALAALRKQFRVVGLCDQIFARAEREARRLGCEAVTGPAALLERDEIHALLLLDAQWFGLWPLELAARRKLPVFCTFSVFIHDARAEAVLNQLGECGLPLTVETPLRSAPATERALELLQRELGRPRLILGASIGAGATARRLSWTAEMIDWCSAVFGAGPSHIAAHAPGDSDLSALFLEWPDGRAAQLAVLRSAGADRGQQIRVVAERGDVQAHLPRVVAWTQAGMRQSQELPHRASGAEQLERFHANLSGGKPPTVGLKEVTRCLLVLRAARRSQFENRRVSCAE
jgi:predicted dehydrogenase